MLVHVRFLTAVREVVPSGETEVELADGATVDDLLRGLGEEYGPGLLDGILRPDGQIWPEVAVMVDGRNIAFSGGLATRLADGGQVTVLPVVSGG
ncbi:MAG: MoaD/ThiS family protein [Dehalococcoidales bacterium]|nr:MoaD/ThiS family protein [Dehalococcoidales bacterium]